MKRKKAVMAAVAAALAFSCAAQVPISVQAKAAELPAEERSAGGLPAEERVAEGLAAAIARQGGATPYVAEGIIGIPRMLRERAGEEDDGIGAIAGLRSEESEGSLRASKSSIAGKKKLKKYILKHGKKMADGNKGITMKLSGESDDNYKGIIEYVASEKKFIFCLKNKFSSGGRYSVAVKMKLPFNDTPKTVQVKFGLKGRTEIETLDYNSIGMVKVATYSQGMTTRFKMTRAIYTAGGVNLTIPSNLKDTCADLADAEFRIGMAIWERMLVDDANTNMKEIGFRSFSQ